MSGSGGGGFVIDIASLFLVMLAMAGLVGTWVWLLSRRKQ